MAPPHNPVTATCTFAEKTYKLTTYNYGKGHDDETEFSRNWKIKLCKDSDIILGQEFTPDLIKSFDDFRPNDVKLYSGCTAVLVKKGTGGAITRLDDDVNDPEHQFDTILPDHDGRHCTVMMDDIIVISWHGKHKVNDMGTNDIVDTEKEKQDLFKQFLKYPCEISREHKLPVVVGGDFNVEADDAETILREQKSCITQFIRKPEKIRVNNYDYFYVVVPFEVNEVVAQKPPSPPPPAEESEVKQLDETLEKTVLY